MSFDTASNNRANEDGGDGGNDGKVFESQFDVISLFFPDRRCQITCLGRFNVVTLAIWHKHVRPEWSRNTIKGGPLLIWPLLTPSRGHGGRRRQG